MAMELKKTPDLSTLKLSVNTVVSDLVKQIFPASSFAALLLHFTSINSYVEEYLRRRKKKINLLKSVQFCGDKLKSVV